MNELFPDGFIGQMWAVIVEPQMQEEQPVIKRHGEKMNVIYMPVNE
jgi:hypothetical protein